MTTMPKAAADRRDLWPALARFSIGERPDEFRRTLAADNGWTDDYARRVIQEYRRFLYIAAVSPFEVTPSKPVDEAWHLHLEDAAHYRLLCAQVLRRQLRHLPSTGAGEDEARFREQYRKTLLVYESVFGPAPRDIWPEPQATEAERVTRDPSAANAAAALKILLVLTIVIFVWIMHPEYLALAAGAGIIGSIAIYRTRHRTHRRRGGDGSGCGGSCGSDGGDSSDSAGCGGSCGGGD
jgi:hypothetical protein